MTFSPLAAAAALLLLARSPAALASVPEPVPEPVRAIAPAAAVRAPRPAAIGVYVAARYNRRPLPAVDRIPTERGYEHYVKLDECVLTLRGDGRFIASAKYYHEYLRRGAAVPPRARLSESYRGTYAVQGARITLYPDRPSRKQPQPDPVHGTLSGDRIAIAIPVDNGSIRRTFAFDFARDPNRF